MKPSSSSITPGIAGSPATAAWPRCMSAVTGEVIAETGSNGLDFGAMLDHARKVGGPALRAMTFHERAWMLKDLANAVMARKEELYELSYNSGATRGDSWIDIEGGAGTLFSFSSKGRRELPNGRVLIDGAMEPLSKTGSFVGQHVFTPLQGVAVHINAFNFPVWGMLEKLGPTLLAGVPAIVKPGSSTGYLTEACVRIMIEAGVLPHGALQLIMGVDRRSDGSSDLPGRGQLHRLGGDGDEAAIASGDRARKRPLRRRARQPERLDPRARRRRRARRNSTCSSRKSRAK